MARQGERMKESVPANASPPLNPDALLARRSPVRNVNATHEAQLGALERGALLITQRVGTMGFFLLIVTWTLLWLGWNLLAPKAWQFDPPSAFVFWLFISNMIQIFLMPLIMVGQNLQSRHAEMRAESDFEVNLKAEDEIETVLRHLEYQNRLLFALIQWQGLSLEEILNPAAQSDGTT
jgi:uncharacterized membrane protein